MADKPNFNKDEFKKDVIDSVSVIEDTVISIFENINTKLKRQVKDTSNELDSAVLSKLRVDINKSVRGFASSLATTRKTLKDTLEGRGKISDILKLQVKMQNSISEIEYRRQLLVKNGLEDSAEMESLQNDLNIAYEDAEEVNESILKYQEDINEQAGLGGKLFQALADTPFLGTLFNAQEATKAINLAVQDGKSGIEAFAEGAKKAFLNLERGTVILAAIAAIKKIFHFIVSSMFRADELTTSIAKNLGVSKDNAENLVEQLQRQNDVLTSTSYITEDLIEAQSQLVQFTGAVTRNLNEQAGEQAFLTKFVGMQAESAALLNIALDNQEQGTKAVFDNVNNTANAAAKQTGIFISAQSILQEIGETSADILGNFAFSADELTNAVLTTRRFGVTLSQAKNISEGLLDFESSIASELEAELLTGRQFNFERARALAVTGDIAGATEEVLKQTQNLTDEQLRSPIIQGAIAKATGLNADELLRARQLTRALNRESKEYNELLEKAATETKRREIENQILQGASAKEIEKNISAQEKFNNALTNAKDQFANLVGSGVIDMLTNILPGVLDTLAFFTGTGYQTDASDDIAAAVQKAGKASGKSEEEINKAVQTAQKKYFEEMRKLDNLGGTIGKRGKKGISNAFIQQAAQLGFSDAEFGLDKGLASKDLYGRTNAFYGRGADKELVNEYFKNLLAESKRTTAAIKDNRYEAFR